MADWNSLLADAAEADHAADAPTGQIQDREAAPDEGAASPSRGRRGGGRNSGRRARGRGSASRTSATDSDGFEAVEGFPDRERVDDAQRFDEAGHFDADGDGDGAGDVNAAGGFDEACDFRAPDGRQGRNTRSRSGSGRQRTGRGKEAAGPADSSDLPADPYEQARSIVLRQLTGAARSRRQLSDKLAERGIPADVAAAVLDRFEEVHLVNDAEFARMWVRSRSRSRSLARGALRRELSEKGITGDMADEALAEIDDDDEHSAALELVRRKLPSRVDLSDRSERDRQTRRLVSMLARRGYAPGLAYRVVGEVFGAELEQLSELEP